MDELEKLARKAWDEYQSDMPIEWQMQYVPLFGEGFEAGWGERSKSVRAKVNDDFINQAWEAAIHYGQYVLPLHEDESEAVVQLRKQDFEKFLRMIIIAASINNA
jgi:hypothetical protein